MASKCPTCNQPYDFDEYKRTGKCSECGEIISNPRKYGTTRYEKATQKSASKKKTEKTEIETIDKKQINKEVKDEAIKAAKKDEFEKSNSSKFTAEKNYDVPDVNEAGTKSEPSDETETNITEETTTTTTTTTSSSGINIDSGDDELAELRRKLEEQKKINEQLEKEKREREKQEQLKNEQSQREAEEQERKRQAEIEKENLLRLLEEERRKGEEISKSFKNTDTHSSDEVVYVPKKTPTKEELIAQREKQKIEESKNRLFNKKSNQTEDTDYDKNQVENNSLEEESTSSSLSNLDNAEPLDVNSKNGKKTAGDWLKGKVTASSNKKINEEEMEIEGIDYASNVDGYYDDVAPKSPIKADVIPKIFFLKIAGVIVGMFAFIAFLIYYA